MIQNRYVQPEPEPEVPEFEVVRMGENLGLFAARVGVEPRQIVRLNDADMQREAQARGFDGHGFQRLVKEEDGREHTVGDYHVFGGQRLRLREPGPA